MITSKLSEEVRMEKDPPQCREAYEWLMIEKHHKGKEWYVKSLKDKGLCLIDCGDNKCYWAFVSEIEVTLDESEYDRRLYCSQNIPKQVGMLITDDNYGVSHLVHSLYNEVYSEVVA